MTDLTIRELLGRLSRDPAAQNDFEADPDGYLAGHGFVLPTELIGEAVVNVAATFPPAIAEHLAGFTTAHSPIPTLEEGVGEIDGRVGLELIATTPTDPGSTALDSDTFDQPEPDRFGDGSLAAADDHVVADEQVDSLDVGLFDDAAGDESMPIDGGGVDFLDELTETRGVPLEGDLDEALDIERSDIDDFDGFE